MEKYIRHSDALAALGNRPENWTNTEAEVQAANDWEMYRSALEAVPGITAEEYAPVVHAHWEERIVEDKHYDPAGLFRKRFYCSACGEWQCYGTTEYCMHCGAKMDEEV